MGVIGGAGVCSQFLRILGLLVHFLFLFWKERDFWFSGRGVGKALGGAVRRTLTKDEGSARMEAS